MQALVLAHAAYGHNHFFKNNYQFRLWTQPDHIIDYLEFAKRYVAECEERHGQDAVESVLDAAHALMNHGVSRDFRTRPRDVAKREREKAERRRAYEEATYDDIYRTLPEIVRENVSEASASMRQQQRDLLRRRQEEIGRAPTLPPPACHRRVARTGLDGQGQGHFRQRHHQIAGNIAGQRLERGDVERMDGAATCRARAVH